ncbi:UvrD-helicase domain-containing protein [Nocardia terpenica]|uniref:UvrD-helicase domain-containing protein n=1 Tax=Nocardia terpenica TaxID=455432 RepID=UPI001E5B0F51|nr:UvrD-helicase domain-containing protein [Nocardia terpenica]
MGGIEIRDDTALDAALPELTAAAARTSDRLFAHISDKDMIKLGIDERTLAAVRTMTSVEQLEYAEGALPTVQWQALYGLAAGMTVDQVWTEIGAHLITEPIDTTDFDTALHRSPAHVLLVDGPDELMKVFAAPFSLWRIYLHPVQQEIVEADYRGPARVTGGPGTGKTVVALHRTNQLAQRGAGRVLLTTFTSALTASLKNALFMLIDDPALSSAVDVLTVDQLAMQVFRAMHGQPQLLSNEGEAELWAEVNARRPSGYNEKFLAEEWRNVVLAQQITTLPGYLEAKRSGRGRALGRPGRDRVWEAVQVFEKALEDRGLWTWETVRREATQLLGATAEKRYRHVVVDEAQDLSPDQWRLLRAAVPVGPNDMFLAGDTHQRIYDNRVSLSDTGVHVRGRSRPLSINYRTTAEILAWSMALLRGEPIDDMDGGIDSLSGCRSEVHGVPPELAGTSSLSAELDRIVTAVRGWLAQGIEPEGIAVATRANWLAKRIAKHLESEAIPTRLVSRNTETDGNVSVGTMHSMKGLEFRCMIVAGVSDTYVPAPAAVTLAADDPHTHRLDLQRERCILFVACTRAREQLLVTWNGPPSRFIAAARSRRI